ncbi:MAG: hotdog fold domain-containing protein [Candidatus Zixiibacteriota bacterium]
MKEIVAYPGCFVCGLKSQIGLKARFFWDGKKAFCDITADEEYAGYKGILHGGIVATLLDEVMIKALLAEELLVVTAEITVRFKKPVYSGDRLHLEGWKIGEKEAVYFTKGQAINHNGITVAKATGRYVKSTNGLSDKLRESLKYDDL